MNKPRIKAALLGSVVTGALLLTAACTATPTPAPSPSATPMPTAATGQKISYDAPFVKRIPFDAKYTQDCAEKGTVETVNYQAHSYVLEAEREGEEIIVDKSMLVYLPYGYTPDKQYDIVYLLHGTGDYQDFWLGDTPMGAATRNMLDNVISSGSSKPVIVVTPTYYSMTPDMQYEDLFDEPNADKWPMYFWQELRTDIIPLIESTYSTYAGGDISEASLQSTRDHRAFAGLSRGSMTTVNSGMMHCADLFSYIGSYSGIWADFEEFKKVLTTAPFADYDFKYWYNGNGSADFALENHEAFRDLVLAEMPDKFRDGENYAWISFTGGSHAFNCWLPHFYNSLLVFFQQ